MRCDSRMGSVSPKDKQSTFYKQVNGFRENRHEEPWLDHARRERKHRSIRGDLSPNVAFYYSLHCCAVSKRRACLDSILDLSAQTDQTGAPGTVRTRES